MSADDKKSVAASWGKATGEWGTAGPDFFMKLFEDDGIYEKFRGLFKGADKGGVKNTTEMAGQAKSFQGLVDDWVKNIDNAAELQKLCSKFTDSHAPRGIKEGQIRQAFGVLGAYMEANYGGSAKAWENIGDVLIGMMKMPQ